MIRRQAMKDEVTGALSSSETFDKETLARLGRIALGGQKISDVMEQTGLSRSTISKLLNQKMSGPPSVDTLRKLARDENSLLFRKMLEACGHPVEWQDELSLFQRVVREMDAVSDTHTIGTQWSCAGAMSTLLVVLEEKKYGTQFQIDYRTEGYFGICTNESKLRIIGVPVVVDDTVFDVRNIVNVAIRGITRGIAQWGLSDIVVLVLTNSASAFSVLKKMPNLSKQMAVLLASENGNGFQEQAIIEPIEKGHGTNVVFPIDLGVTDHSAEI